VSTEANSCKNRVHTGSVQHSIPPASGPSREHAAPCRAALLSKCLGIEKDWIFTRRLKCLFVAISHRKFAMQGVLWKA